VAGACSQPCALKVVALACAPGIVLRLEAVPEPVVPSMSDERQGPCCCAKVADVPTRRRFFATPGANAWPVVLAALGVADRSAPQGMSTSSLGSGKPSIKCLSESEQSTRAKLICPLLDPFRGRQRSASR